MQLNPETPVVLSIAGSDSGGGAGIQADLLSIHANGCFPTTAITCLTAQNPDGVTAIEVMPAEFVHAQIRQVTAYFNIKAIKTGMLFNADIINTVADLLAQSPQTHLIVDPVMVATSGAVLLQEDAVDALKTKLMPLASLITPNLDEAGVLLGSRPRNTDDMFEAARELAQRSKTTVLLKGGHLETDSQLVDVLALQDGKTQAFENKRIRSIHTHGSGCTLASTLAARFALGETIEVAVKEALNYLQNGMRQPVYLNGTPFIRH